MRTVRDTGLLFQRYTLQMLRNPVWLFVGFSTPVLYLALFTPAAQGSVPLARRAERQRARVLPSGHLVPLGVRERERAWASARSSSSSPGVIERFRVTPASRFAILVGPILSGLVMMTVFDSVVVAVGYGFGFHVHWLGLVVLAVLLALLASLMAAFSTATALVTKDISSFAAIINGMNLPMLLLAGRAPADLGRTAVDAGARRTSTRSSTWCRPHGPSQPARSARRRSGRPSPSWCRSARSCSSGRRGCSGGPSPETDARVSSAARPFDREQIVTRLPGHDTEAHSHR